MNHYITSHDLAILLGKMLRVSTLKDVVDDLVECDEQLCQDDDPDLNRAEERFASSLIDYLEAMVKALEREEESLLALQGVGQVGSET